MGKPYERPVVPDEAKDGAADAIAAARGEEPPSLLSGFTNDPGGSTSLGGASETKKNAFNPGDMAKFTAAGERERYAAEQAAKRAAEASHTDPQPFGPAVRPTSKFGQHGAGYGPHARSASSPMTLPPGERERHHAEQEAQRPPANGKRPDATLADAISPQMGLGFDVEVVGAAPPGLADKFIAPPFSVLDTRAGYWQDRRRAWLSIGFRGETTAEVEYHPNSTRGPRDPGVYGGAGGAPASLKSERKPALNTTAGEHEAWGHQGAAAAHHGGRAQGLIYDGDRLAKSSDPAFYEEKAAKERELGRSLTVAEFRGMRDESESASESVKTGTSVFDPVLCEVGYRWFSGEGAQVLDPFAGGVVRGAVAAILGRRYWGCELRPEQIADNRRQADALFGPGGPDFGREPEMPVWHEGDATRLGEYSPPAADLVFTCPPYADLEVYSSDPRDLSTMSYEKFRNGLMDAMEASTEALRPNRFAVWVVGECRGKDGMEYGFVADTVKVAQACGLKPYNSAILLNSVGSAALRAQMILRSRKLTRVHQHVLVFVKGDPKKAATACGTAEVDV